MSLIDYSGLKDTRPLWYTASALLAGDFVTTYIGLQRGLGEANPFVASMIEAGGVWQVAISKLFVLGVAVVLYSMTDEHEEVVPMAIILVMGVVLTININVLMM